MRSMDNERSAAPALPARDASSSTRSTRRFGKPMLVLIVLAFAGFAWWYFTRETRERDASVSLAEQVEALDRTTAQLRRDLDSLRSRAGDADALNRGIREEVLAFGERSRALEDAVANLADQRLNNRDAMALNEAEFILQLAGERLSLFGDASAAIAAYRLADSALATAEDPLFASVRQTIRAEIAALEASQPLATRTSLDALAGLRGGLASWPPRTLATPAATSSAESPSRWRQLLAPFVRIRQDDGSAAIAVRNDDLHRALVGIDLRTAEAMLLSRDEAGFRAALQRARTGIEAAYDIQAATVKAGLATLDRLQGQALTPALPELGTALVELRNLRTTRALAKPAPAGTATDGGQP